MEPTSSPRPTRPRKSGVVVPHRANWKQRLGARLVWLIVQFLSRTARVCVEDRSGLITSAPPGARCILALWHNRVILAFPLHQRLVSRRQPERHLAALVSASRDGAFLAQVMALFGVEAVRGSSSRRGAQALRELAGAAERGFDLAVTPDGPRGPRYEVQEGVIAAAQLSGLPIVPGGYNLGAKLTIKSWDRLQIPLPFTRCDVVIGEPLHVPRDLTDEQRAELCRELQRRLMAITRD